MGTGAGTGTIGAGALTSFKVRVAQAETAAPLAITNADLISVRRVCTESRVSVTGYPLPAIMLDLDIKLSFHMG
jgi:hypothetical protein